jgi:hypothetical protein
MPWANHFFRQSEVSTSLDQAKQVVLATGQNRKESLREALASADAPRLAESMPRVEGRYPTHPSAKWYIRAPPRLIGRHLPQPHDPFPFFQLTGDVPTFRPKSLVILTAYSSNHFPPQLVSLHLTLPVSKIVRTFCLEFLSRISRLFFGWERW